MAALVYLACAATALTCCILLLRGYRASRAQLLLWSGLCFAGLTLENLILLADRVIFPTIPLYLINRPLGLISVLVLLYGILWKSK